MVSKTPKGQRRPGNGQHSSRAVAGRAKAHSGNTQASTKRSGGGRAGARKAAGSKATKPTPRQVVVKRVAPDPVQARQRFAASYLASTKSAEMDALRSSGRTVLIFAAAYGQARSIAIKQELKDWVYVRNVETLRGMDPATIATITVLGYQHDDKVREAKHALDQIARAFGVTIPSFDPT